MTSEPMTPGIEPLTPGTEPMSLSRAVMATVAYSDVFDMPIEIERLRPFLFGRRAEPNELAAAVETMVDQGRLGRSGQLLYLPGREEVMAVHADRTERAAEMWPKATRWGRRIGRLPNVVSVAVTGGLAVDSVAPHDDADYFIVTRPGRLWLTRLLILVLVRLAERDDIELCPNYLVSHAALDMKDHSIYVARELAQMVPIVGPEVCIDLRDRNRWMFDHLPNASLQGDLRRAQPASRLAPVTRLAERLIDLSLFDRVERWEMERKVARLRTVRSRRPEVGSPDESSFSPDVCKGHMVGNAAGIDVAWRDRLATADEPADKPVDNERPTPDRSVQPEQR